MARRRNITKILPKPPLQKKPKALHVEIDGEVSLRLKLALVVLEAEGVATPKRRFVEDALIEALDAFDEERSS